MLGSDYFLSIFCGLALIVEFLLKTFNLIQEARRNNSFYNIIYVYSFKGTSTRMHKYVVLVLDLKFGI